MLKRNRLTIEFVKEEFNKRSLVLLDDIYKNNQTKLKYLCKKHLQNGVQEVSYGTLSQGHGCKFCGIEKRSEKLRMDFDYIKCAFLKENYELLETNYKNNHSKLKYICGNHLESGIKKITWNDFNSGKRCAECSKETYVSKRKLDFNFIKQEFAKKNYEILSETYINANTNLIHKCQLHPDNEQDITWANFNQGNGCYYCAIQSSANKRRLSDEEVNKLFLSKGYTMLDKYINSNIPINYICKEHLDKIQHISYSNLYQGKGCRYCYEDKRRNELTALAAYLRRRINDWKTKSMQLCNYRCVITGERFNVVHHLYPFHKILEECIIETGIEIKKYIKDYTEEELLILLNKCVELHFKYPLGVCLTKELHYQFHSLYGYECTPQQFYKFKEIKIKELQEQKVGVAS